MRNLVQPGQAEQGLGLQPTDAEPAVLDKAAGDPAGLGEGRQQQGVQPDDEAGQQPGHRPGPRALLPVHAAENGRRELGDGGK